MRKQFTNELSQEIYEQTYKYGDETLEKTQKRIADDIASIEVDKEKWSNEFFSILQDFKFVPGGRIISNAGTKIKGTTYINCFTADTNVLTRIGYKKISDIEIGDEVLTHMGRYRKVVNTMERQYDGKINIYSSSNLTSNIKVTLEHPFYQGNNEWINSEQNNKLVIFNHKKDWKFIARQNKDVIDLYDYVKDIKRDGKSINSIVKESDKIYTVISSIGGNGSKVNKMGEPIKRKIIIDEDFAYFIGRYVGDGSTFSVNGSYEVDGFNVVFNNKEIDSSEKIKNILHRKIGIEMNVNETNFNGFYLRKNTPLFSYFLMKTCGKYSDTKKIPDYIWISDEKIKMSFLLGLFDADGMITDSSVKITLNNEELISNVQALLLELGIPSTKNKVYVKDYPNKIYYQLTLTTLYSKDFVKKMSKKYDDDRIVDFLTKNISDASKGQFQYSIKEEINDFDDRIFVVNKFEKNDDDFSGLVYNISVEEDESYIVNNVVVHNCFVSGFQGENQDSMEGIMSELKRQAMILKSEGGYGFCADVMRPRGGFISGIANESPGSVRMLDMWNTQSDVITAGSGKKSAKKEVKQKIRKGAQMVTMSCWNPSIEEFITAKQTPGRLDKFNMSVLITDDFMNAVKNNLEWKLIYPDFDAIKETYDKEWDGNIKKWISNGYPVKTWKTYKNANELWDIIMRSTYNRNEPGVLFIDTVNRLNNLYYLEYISSSNPCVVGDTLIATADGRNAVSIKQLAIEGKDVPVYSTNEEGKVEIKWGRNPRLTGKKKEVWKLTLDDGSTFIATPDHGIYLIDNTYKELKDLQEGDSISSFYSFVSNKRYRQMVRVEFYGYEDVYNITVDDNHNYNIINSFDDDRYITSGGICVKNCGEQLLPTGGVCLLGNLNLTQFINDSRDNWDYDKLAEIIPIAVRFMDNVNDLTYVPLPEQKENLVNKRRIGLGILGYGSSLLIMKKRYGSSEALRLTEELMNFIANKAYQSSSLLAKEKGSFLLFDADKYLESNFLKVLSDETKNMIRKYGIRNSHLMSIQPTGNCVRKNTIIKTENGNMTMNEIFKSNKININKSDKNKWYIPIRNINVETINGYNRITGLYINNKKNILSIRTNNNNLIEGTNEHKVLVKINDKEAIWKNLGDLKVGDKILKKKILMRM